MSNKPLNHVVTSSQYNLPSFSSSTNGNTNVSSGQNSIVGDGERNDQAPSVCPPILSSSSRESYQQSSALQNHNRPSSGSNRSVHISSSAHRNGGINNKAVALLSQYLEKLSSLKTQHVYASNALDLTLETTPRDSKYSSYLMELMKKEETLLLKGGGSSSASSNDLPSTTKMVIHKVDDALKQETKAFFHKLMSSNMKKWEHLQEKMKKERESLKNELIRELSSSNPVVSGEFLRFLSSLEGSQGKKSGSDASAISSATVAKRPSSPSHVFTAEDLAKEEERLSVDYYSHWYQYETIHLQEAFRLQTLKIDRDWNAHEMNLRNDFEAKKAPYLTSSFSSSHGSGKSSNATTPTTRLEDEKAADGHSHRQWHNAEKQKTLIHTAPVFTPSTTRPTSSGGFRGNAGKKDSNNSMLNALEVRLLWIGLSPNSFHLLYCVALLLYLYFFFILLCLICCFSLALSLSHSFLRLCCSCLLAVLCSSFHFLLS
jgi:hypothetical protein